MQILYDPAACSHQVRYCLASMNPSRTDQERRTVPPHHLLLWVPLSSMSKPSLIPPCPPFLIEPLALPKGWTLCLPVSAQSPRTRRQTLASHAEGMLGLFHPALKQICIIFYVNEISFWYSAYQQGDGNVKKMSAVERKQRKLSPCLLQLRNESHLLNVDCSPYTPEFCWWQQLFIFPSILVFLQMSPSSSSSLWALTAVRASTEGQNLLTCNFFSISFGEQWWIVQILRDNLCWRMLKL